MLKCHFRDKSDFRKSCILKLKFSSKFAKLKKDIEVCNKIEIIIKKSGKKNILLFIPFRFEVNVLPLIAKLRKTGRYNIFVPFITGESFVAVRFRLPLKSNKFGIKEPSFSYFGSKIDIAVVPVVGIDGRNCRIGFGKGMYDRFFSALKYKPKLIFTQIKLCKTTQILSENHDIKADYIVSTTNK